MELVIGILTGGLLGMAVLVVVLTGYVLRRNQRPPDQALVAMVQDLVNVVLTAKRSPQRRWPWPPVPADMTPEQTNADLGPQVSTNAEDDDRPTPDDRAGRVAKM